MPRALLLLFFYFIFFYQNNEHISKCMVLQVSWLLAFDAHDIVNSSFMCAKKKSKDEGDKSQKWSNTSADMPWN